MDMNPASCHVSTLPHPAHSTYQNHNLWFSLALIQFFIVLLIISFTARSIDNFFGGVKDAHCVIINVTEGGVVASE